MVSSSRTVQIFELFHLLIVSELKLFIMDYEILLPCEWYKTNKCISEEHFVYCSTMKQLDLTAPEYKWYRKKVVIGIPVHQFAAQVMKIGTV